MPRVESIMQLFYFQMPDPIQMNDSTRLWWTRYLKPVDEDIVAQLPGNLPLYTKAALLNDPYSADLKLMGYRFEDGKAAKFLDAMVHIFGLLHENVKKFDLSDDDTIYPAAHLHFQGFESLNIEEVCVPHQAGKDDLFLPYLACVTPEMAKHLAPTDWQLDCWSFVCAVAKGHFPMGYRSEKEFGFQSLAEHDLAHLMAFCAMPNYMTLTRQICKKIVNSGDQTKRELSMSSSPLSLRIFYFVEQLVVVQEKAKQSMNELLKSTGVSANQIHCKDIQRELEVMAHECDTDVVREKIEALYSNSIALLEPLGGQSRDIVMRSWKFGKADSTSKFYRTSVYFFYLSGKQAFDSDNKSDSYNMEVHAEYVAALMACLDLDPADWASAFLDPGGEQHHNLVKRLNDSGIFDQENLMMKAFSDGTCVPYSILV